MNHQSLHNYRSCAYVDRTKWHLATISHFDEKHEKQRLTSTRTTVNHPVCTTKIRKRHRGSQCGLSQLLVRSVNLVWTWTSLLLWRTNHRNCCRILVEVRSVSPAPSTARPIKRDWTAISFRALQGGRGCLISPFRQQVPVVLEYTLRHVYKITTSLKLLLLVPKLAVKRIAAAAVSGDVEWLISGFTWTQRLNETMQYVTCIGKGCWSCRSRIVWLQFLFNLPVSQTCPDRFISRS